MAWGWEQSDDAHRQVYGGQEEPQHHEAKFSHELIAGAASFAGMKAWEDHQRKEGKTVKHAFAKEALAGLVGAEVDKLVESKGMDEVDKIKAHHHAKQNAEKMYEEHYESRGGEEWHSGYERHERFERFDGPGRFDGPPWWPLRRSSRWSLRRSSWWSLRRPPWRPFRWSPRWSSRWWPL
ncbi:hypothetical protein N7528_009927, partial [Penicillium herquei]